MRVTPVSLRVLQYGTILINAWGRSLATRVPALQVDNAKRCAFTCFRRWATSAVPRIISSSSRAQNRLREPIGRCRSTKPSPARPWGVWGPVDPGPRTGVRKDPEALGPAVAAQNAGAVVGLEARRTP